MAEQPNESGQPEQQPRFWRAWWLGKTEAVQPEQSSVKLYDGFGADLGANAVRLLKDQGPGVPTVEFSGKIFGPIRYDMMAL